jgi:hypothetical protein
MKIAILILFAAPGWAQQLDLSSLDKFAEKASESSNVNLGAEKLQLASKLFSENKQGKARELVSGMKAIFVRTFEFNQNGAYAIADLEPIRTQLRAPGWSKVVEVKEDDESAEVYFFQKGNEFGGLAVIAAEPRELAVVNIVGPVDLSMLGRLTAGKWVGDLDKYMTSPKRRRLKPDPQE